MIAVRPRLPSPPPQGAKVEDLQKHLEELNRRLSDVLARASQEINSKTGCVYDDPAWWMES